jgi:D-tyrosyl-tRNA(Tyr) deacylase
VVASRSYNQIRTDPLHANFESAPMKALVQRVSEADVTVEGEVVGAIGPGLLVLLGVEAGDGAAEADLLARKIAALRIFEDDAGKMNLALREAGGAVLAISQFTLAADLRKGNRPSFIRAAPPEIAEPLYEQFCTRLREAGLEVATGRFGAQMAVRLINHGPVTIWLDSASF